MWNKSIEKARRETDRRKTSVFRILNLFVTESLFMMLGPDHCVDAAANKKITFNAHPARLDGVDQIIQNFVGHRFMKCPFITVAPKIEL